MVDVVVVSFNSTRHLPRLFEALAAQTRQDFQVILWDNASAPEERPSGLPEGMLFRQSEDNLGFAAGSNRAAALGRAPFIAMLNPDAFPEPDWLEELLAAAGRWPGAAAFGAVQIRDEDDSRWDGLGDVLHACGAPYRAGHGRPRTGPPPPEGETFSACAAAMLVRRHAFEAAGGFDERLFCFGEDVDLGFRLRLLGWPSLLAPRAAVRHVGGASTGRRSAFADRLAVRNRLWVFLKNMPAPLLALLLPVHLLASGLLLASYPLSGRGFAGWRGFAEAWLGLGPVLADRRRVQQARTASTVAIARALAWSPLALWRRSPVVRRADASCQAGPGVLPRVHADFPRHR